jgi:hypothetical protein
MPAGVLRRVGYTAQLQGEPTYSGRKITESLGNVTVRRGKRWKEQEWSAIVNSLSEHV